MAVGWTHSSALGPPQVHGAGWPRVARRAALAGGRLSRSAFGAPTGSLNPVFM